MTETIFKNISSELPDKAWSKLKSKCVKIEVTPLPLLTPLKDDHVRFVCVSDTHAIMHKMSNPIPPGDVLLHAGDFTGMGHVKQVEQFNEFLGHLPHSYKVVIAGNHEISFDPQNLHRSPSNDMPSRRSLLSNCIYLEDQATTIMGYKIYGSPWTPRFHDWAFNEDRGVRIMQRWNQIPDDTDILITHGPPIGYGDRVVGGYHVGCVDLLNTVKTRVRPRVHLFGHIHEGYGMWTDHVTTFINAAICDHRYRPVNPPIIFDLPLLPGHVKSVESRPVANQTSSIS